MNSSSIYLSTFWGLFLMLSVLALALIPSYKLAIYGALRDRKTQYLGAFVALTIGIASIYVHNIWTSGVVGLITLFGWISLVKGIIIITIPSSLKLTERIIENKWLAFYLLFLFSLGSYLLLWAIRSPLNF